MANPDATKKGRRLKKSNDADPDESVKNRSLARQHKTQAKQELIANEFPVSQTDASLACAANLPDGVLVVHFVPISPDGKEAKTTSPKDFKDNRKATAAYLGFRDCKPLADWICTPGIHEWFWRWYQEPNRKVANTNPVFALLKSDEFFGPIARANLDHTADISAIQAIVGTTMFRPEEWSLALQAFLAIKIMVAAPEIFVASHPTGTFRFDPEDAHRAITVIRMYADVVERSKNRAATSNFVQNGGFIRLNSQPTGTVYYADPKFPDGTTTDEAMMEGINANANFEAWTEMEMTRQNELAATKAELLYGGGVAKTVREGIDYSDYCVSVTDQAAEMISGKGDPRGMVKVPQGHRLGVMTNLFSQAKPLETEPCIQHLRAEETMVDFTTAIQVELASPVEDSHQAAAIAAATVLEGQRDDDDAARQAQLSDDADEPPSPAVAEEDVANHTIASHISQVPPPPDLPTMEEAYERYGFDPAIKNPSPPMPEAQTKQDLRGPLQLNPVQVEGAAWLDKKTFDSQQKAAVLAHRMGLGKTITSLYYLERAIEKYIDQQKNEAEPYYRPQLICVPAQLLIQWLKEFEQRFKKHSRIQPHVFHLSSANSSTNALIRSYFISQEDMVKELVFGVGGRFQPDNPQTAWQVVFTGLQTFALRSVYTKFDVWQYAEWLQLDRDVFGQFHPQLGHEEPPGGLVDAPRLSKVAANILAQARKEMDKIAAGELTEDPASADAADVPEEPTASPDDMEEALAEEHETGQESGPVFPAEERYRIRTAKAVAELMSRRKGTRGVPDGAHSEGAAQNRRDNNTTKAMLDHYTSIFHRKFQFVILDEASYAKNMFTNYFKSIYLLGAEFVVCLSGTPAPNKLIDWLGYLHLAFNDQGDAERHDDWVRLTKRPSPADLAQMTAAQRSELPANGPLAVMDWLEQKQGQIDVLNPFIFQYFLVRGEMPSEYALRVLPVVLSQLALARAYHDDIPLIGGIREKAGQDIPAYHIFQPRLIAPLHKRREYRKIFQRLIKDLDIQREDEDALADPENEEGRYNMGVIRSLMLASFNPSLDFLQNMMQTDIMRSSFKVDSKSLKEGERLDSAPVVNRWSSTSNDFGTSLLLNNTLKDADLAINPIDVAAKRVMTLANQSIKLLYLTGILRFHAHLRDEKVIITAEWPLVQFNTAAFCATLGFEVLTLRSDMSEDARAEVLEKWNDPFDPARILITTMRLAAFGHNLHIDCHVITCLEAPVSYHTFAQAVGRIHRIGQTHKQWAYQLLQLATLDEYRHYNAAKKFDGAVCSGGTDGLRGVMSQIGNEVTGDMTLDEQREEQYLQQQVAIERVTNLMTGAPSTTLRPLWGDIRQCGIEPDGRRSEGRDQTRVEYRAADKSRKATANADPDYVPPPRDFVDRENHSNALSTPRKYTEEHVPRSVNPKHKHTPYAPTPSKTPRLSQSEKDAIRNFGAAKGAVVDSRLLHYDYATLQCVYCYWFPGKNSAGCDKKRKGAGVCGHCQSADSDLEPGEASFGSVCMRMCQDHNAILLRTLHAELDRRAKKLKRPSLTVANNGHKILAAFLKSPNRREIFATVVVPIVKQMCKFCETCERTISKKFQVPPSQFALADKALMEGHATAPKVRLDDLPQVGPVTDADFGSRSCLSCIMGSEADSCTLRLHDADAADPAMEPFYRCDHKDCDADFKCIRPCRGHMMAAKRVAKLGTFASKKPQIMMAIAKACRHCPDCFYAQRPSEDSDGGPDDGGDKPDGGSDEDEADQEESDQEEADSDDADQDDATDQPTPSPVTKETPAPKPVDRKRKRDEPKEPTRRGPPRHAKRHKKDSEVGF